MLIETLLIVACVAGAAAVVIRWDAILTSLRGHRLRHGDVAVLIRERLTSGNGVMVSARIFEHTALGPAYYSESWTGTEVDAALQAVFNASDNAMVEL